ncbi:MAG: hypothetical protein AB7Q17_01635 [Phycisphaerae bacterium]
MPQLPDTDPYAEDRPLIACCAHLRTKSQFFVPAEMQAGRGRIANDAAGAYWCAQTNARLGPDDEAATPALCQPGRCCFFAAG